jgi:prepilin-type N-terminal cleavage/methylation domain-containing protein
MKKLSFKAFTLVEMLIVIVIIGILISALLPRLQGAQNMARDTARQTALQQIASAIVAYQMQRGVRPNVSSASGDATSTANLTGLVSMGIISDIPKDRNLDNVVSGLGTNSIE